MEEPGSPEIGSHLNRMVGCSRAPSPRGRWAKAAPSVATRTGCSKADGLSGDKEGGMSRRDERRKHGTTRGSPRPAGTAKAWRITGTAGKSRRACEWGGWGRISVDGPGQNNPDRSEGPWGRAIQVARMAVFHRANGSDTERKTRDGCGEHEGGGKPGDVMIRRRKGRPRSTGQPWSRTGENPPYGILGGAVETSASFEARSAPPPHPTPLSRGEGKRPRVTAARLTRERREVRVEMAHASRQLFALAPRRGERERVRGAPLRREVAASP
jgi:hypothetical protein